MISIKVVQKKGVGHKAFRPESLHKKAQNGYRPLSIIHEVDVGFAFWNTF